MENNSEFIATVSETLIEEITNNGTIIINNVKILIKRDEELHIPKRNIINIDYNEIKKEILFIYSYRQSKSKIYVRFDENSQSAYDSFKKTLLELNKVKGVLYYPNSGNIRMEGEFTIDEESGRYSANGNAIVYFDTFDKTIYYEGEIDHENYDGKGVFYNINGNISLEINNMDQNNPIGNGILSIQDHMRKEVYKKVFNFDDMDEIDLSNNFDLNVFVDTYNNTIFNDFKNHSEFMKKYEVEKSIQCDLGTMRIALYFCGGLFVSLH